MIKVGLFGYGHLGKIHFKCLKNTPFQIIGIHDPILNTESHIENVPVFKEEDALIAQSDACIVASTTKSHFKLASKIVELSKHVFVEKPMTSSLHQAKKLVKLIKDKPDLVTQVGFVERYNPAFTYVKDFIINPRFIEVHRLSTFSERGNDVSVVFDLMIHDLDLILSMMKAEIKEIKATGVKLITDTLDICNVRLEFTDHSVANITASRMSMKNMRKFRIFQQKSYLSMDLNKKEAQIVELSDTEVPDSVQIPLGGKEKHFTFKSSGALEGNAIADELNDFYSSIVNKKQSSTNFKNALKTSMLADEIETIALQSAIL